MVPAMTDPYQPFPNSPIGGAASEQAAIRPNGVTAIAIVCLIGGGFGCLIGCLTLLQMIFADQIQALSTVAAGPNAEEQAAFQNEVAAVTDRFIIPNAISGLATLGLSAALFVGGIGLLVGKAWAGRWMPRILVVAIVFEILRGILYATIQLQMLPVMETFGEQMSRAGDGPDGEMLSQMMRISVFAGLAFWATWALIKLGLLTWAIIYLRGSTAREYLLGSAG